jgi:ribosomal protein S18 acetylase RimI-like enzyme
LTARPPTYVDGTVDADELDAIAQLVEACDIAVLGEIDNSRDDIAFMLASPSTDRAASQVVRDGEDVVGFVWVERDTSGSATWVDVFAHPRRHADAILAFGLPRGVAAARRHQAESGRTQGGTQGWTVRSGCFEPDARTGAALVAHGFTLARRFWRMRIDSRSPEMPTTTPALPDGVALVIARDEEDRRRLHALEEASFADHWNFSSRSYEEWSERQLAGGGVDPDGWWLLEVDGVPAAACVIDDSRVGLGDGYVATLGVAREFRGRGLAKLLLRRAFVGYRERGLTGTQLTVDSDSPTGAQRLYESVGMTPIRVLDAYSLELAPEADPTSPADPTPPGLFEPR